MRKAGPHPLADKLLDIGQSVTGACTVAAATAHVTCVQHCISGASPSESARISFAFHPQSRKSKSQNARTRIEWIAACTLSIGNTIDVRYLIVNRTDERKFWRDRILGVRKRPGPRLSAGVTPKAGLARNGWSGLRLPENQPPESFLLRRGDAESIGRHWRP